MRLHLTFLINVLSLLVIIETRRFASFRRDQMREARLEGRIVGGITTTIDEFPFVVSIQKKSWLSSTHFCGGSLFNERWILTAAHCVCKSKTAIELKTNVFKVFAGLTDSSDTDFFGQHSSVTDVYKHPQYDHKSIHNDIALLRLQSPFTLSSTVQPVKLAPSEVKYLKSEMAEVYVDGCIAVGWGALEFRGSVTDILRMVKLPLLAHDECNRLLFKATYATSKQVCTLYRGGGKDACQGDSGGPLVCEGLQIGITSWGNGCGWLDNPGVWTKVAAYRDWIDGVIKASSATVPFTNKYITFIAMLILLHRILYY